ncbi:hypothetical protein TPHA_0C01550 [Tetrapisispora phaffii CBS 4417]|uniref:RRM domain-containing protein n=1 Tax=Tetrapisispora phaffii (strain ATCC 24235 / CBS 4417 / NBRC 1672 / NRRL Y-8282 / UCD 70-5) TaxID=1071381 RepID=G8BRD5_TETPH|nr:hypothetical protein TPHA_0C01550 [Tetrapisispora phaffii CBS 4417]CCE62311.1 hypothetical protein TPHA_0C01550 [Tetrapisispora phaffii CBS 4417]
MTEPAKKKQKTTPGQVAHPKDKPKGTKKSIPKSTLYINNLSDGIGSKNLRTNLFLLFSVYGEVIKISVNTKRQRGQAFIRMKNVDQANLAKVSLNGEIFFDKQLQIEFSANEMKAV